MGEITRLKARARRLYLSVQADLDSVDCGLSMLCYIRPSVARDIEAFRVTWARLQALDPTAPKGCPL
jgi:hypothetical protein